MRFLLLSFLLACHDPKPADSEVETVPLDVDGDGYTVEEGDCNDESALVGPQATEVCDGVDNDCNGAIDEIGSNTYYADDDGDGFGTNETVKKIGRAHV